MDSRLVFPLSAAPDWNINLDTVWQLTPTPKHTLTASFVPTRAHFRVLIVQSEWTAVSIHSLHHIAPSRAVEPPEAILVGPLASIMHGHHTSSPDRNSRIPIFANIEPPSLPAYCGNRFRSKSAMAGPPGCTFYCKLHLLALRHKATAALIMEPRCLRCFPSPHRH